MIKPFFKTPIDHHYFFGYYDKSPISPNGNLLLAMRVDFIDHLPTKNDYAEIGYFDLSIKSSFIVLTKTNTFNWQQGSMLQWIDNDSFIFNDIHENKFVSKVFNISDNKIKVFKKAIYVLSRSKKIALCIDNERHYWCRRGYSYDGVINNEKNVSLYKDDAIFSLCLSTNQLNKIIHLTDIVSYRTISSMNNSIHYLEHLMINPDCSRFAFFHRWKTKSGAIFTRLYSVNIDGSNLFLLNDSGRMSHYCWKNNSQIIGWGGMKNYLNSIRKNRFLSRFLIQPLLPVYKMLVKGNAIDGSTVISKAVTGDSYILFNDLSKDHIKINLPSLNKDGHPSCSPENEDLLITDTYPDKDGLCNLIIVNLKEKKTVIVDQLSSIKKYDNSVNRCDLHPRWSTDGNSICIDTMNDGVRSMYIYLTPII